MTSDMALSAIEKTVNNSEQFKSEVEFNLVSVYASRLCFDVLLPTFRRLNTC